ncbi:MAG: hypothetical protein RPR40_10175 [Bermanella sp.]
MSTTVIKIEDEESAWAHIQNAINGQYNDQVVELSFDNWPNFHANVKGDRYNSTITTSLMRSMLDLQSHLNRVYAEVIHGKSANSLTQEERNALEIVFKVEEGSSELLSNLSGFFTEMGKGAMEKMTGKQVVTVVIGVAALWAASSTYTAFLQNHEKEQAEKNRHEITLQLIKQQPKLLQIQNEQVAIHTNILKSVPDAVQVTLGDTVISKDVIRTITKQERQTSEWKRIDDLYSISSLKIKTESYKIDVLRASDGKFIATELPKGQLSIDEMDSLMKSFTKEQYIHLNIVGRVRGDTVTSAHIVGINNKISDNQVAKAEPQKPSSTKEI